jgi:hypothetical protein
VLFRRAAVAVLALAVVAVVTVVVVGGGGEPAPPPPAPTPTATSTHAPAPAKVTLPLDEPATGPSLAVGITETNPSLVATRESRAVPPEWERWRDALARIEPALYRLVVPWSSVQPTVVTVPNLALPSGGCMRDKGPCAAYAGLRDQLRALASRQAEQPGLWEGLIVITGMPEWAARRVPGCTRGASPAAAFPRRSALPAYRALIGDVLAVAAAEGATIRYVSPWNEPNHPYFLAPQRAECDASSPSLAIAPYAALADSARRALAAVPGDQRLVLGETAGFVEPTSRATSVPELIRGLPRALICAAPVWGQHAYIGGTGPVAAVTAALDARHCPRRHAIWITETGVGPAPGGLSLARGITSERQGCRLLHQRLLTWYRDPRVTLAVQYTFREDDLFPTGLATTDLTRARPALREWQAWGRRDRPNAPPPKSTCGAGA